MSTRLCAGGSLSLRLFEVNWSRKGQNDHLSPESLNPHLTTASSWLETGQPVSFSKSSWTRHGKVLRDKPWPHWTLIPLSPALFEILPLHWTPDFDAVSQERKEGNWSLRGSHLTQYQFQSSQTLRSNSAYLHPGGVPDLSRTLQFALAHPYPLLRPP